MNAPTLSIREIAFFERPVRLRLPFRFGDTEVTATAEAYVRLTVETGTGPATGHAAQLMVPRWFDKRPELDNDATVEELRETLRAAGRAAPGLRGSVAELSAALRNAVIEAMPADTPRLASGFGPALVEAALIDAVCRQAGAGFVGAARADLFGLAEAAPDDITADDLRVALTTLHAPGTMALRHTVGYGSPLRSDEVASRPDAMPVALEEVISAWDVRYLKIKLKGDPDGDLAWLGRIAGILNDSGATFQFSLDANEQYGPEAFAAFIDGFTAHPGFDALRDGLLFVEQPFPREIALADDGPQAPAGVPIVIDEADDTPDALPRALSRGWAGTSVKSCKGVLRALTNHARAKVAARDGRRVIITSEDLTCQPGLAWQQDTLMAAAVGAAHSERNGHFFAGGMQGAPDAEKASYLDRHADIYRAGAAGPELRITDGSISITTLDTPGFGSAVIPDLRTAREIAI